MIKDGIIAMAGRAASIIDGGRGAMTFSAGHDLIRARIAAGFLVDHGLTVNSNASFVDKKIDETTFAHHCDSWLTYFHDTAIRLLGPHIPDLRMVADRLVAAGDLDEHAVLDLISHLPLVTLDKS